MKQVLSAVLVVALVGCGSDKDRDTATSSEYVQPHETTTISTTTTADPATAAPEPSPVPSSTTTESSHEHGRVPSGQRAVALAAGIMAPELFSDPQVRSTYARAKLVADRLDKMYCYCHCNKSEQLQHKSLLTCFETDHAAECGICLNEAELAHSDWRAGVPVEATIKTVAMMYADVPAAHH